MAAVLAGPTLLDCRDSSDFGECVSTALLPPSGAVTPESDETSTAVAEAPAIVAPLADAPEDVADVPSPQAQNSDSTHDAVPDAAPTGAPVASEEPATETPQGDAAPTAPSVGAEAAPTEPPPAITSEPSTPESPLPQVEEPAETAEQPDVAPFSLEEAVPPPEPDVAAPAANDLPSSAPRAEGADAPTAQPGAVAEAEEVAPFQPDPPDAPQIAQPPAVADEPEAPTAPALPESPPASPQPEAPADLPPADPSAPEASPEPAPFSVDPAPDAPPADGPAPQIDIVRIEPDGSALIAGSASPGAVVELYADDALIGTEVAGPNGDWVSVASDPLPPGGVDLRVLDTETGTFATGSIAVVVAEDRSSEPLVVASADGEASEILQGLERPDPPPFDPSETAAPSETDASAPADASDTDQPASPGEDPVETVAEAPATEPIAEPVSPIVLPPTIDAIEVDGDNTFFAGGGAEDMTVRLYVDNEYVADTRVNDGRWLVEAGDVLTEESQRVRADLLSADGTVLSRAEVNFVLDLPDDVVPPPVSVAEVPEITPPLPADIEPEQPAEEPAPVVVAPPVSEEAGPEPEPVISAPHEPESAPVATNPQPSADAAPEAPVETPAEEAEPAPIPQPNLPASPPPADSAPTAVAEQPPVVVDIPSPPSTNVAPEQSPAVVADDEPLEVEPFDMSTDEPAEPAPTPVPETSVEPDSSTAVPAPSPAASAEAEPEIPTLVGVQSGDRIVSGRAIIRSGDNLWTIARRVYGAGIRYTQIYQANEGQIRNPDLIYPGQVFDLPEESAGL